MEAKRLLVEKATDVGIRYVYAMPQAVDASLREAFLSGDEYCEVSEYNEQNIAVAATTIAADLMKAAGFGAPAVCRNPGSFAPTVSGRGRGSFDPY